MLRRLPAPILLCLLLCPQGADAGLFGDASKPYVAPNGMFQVNVPPNWTIKQGKNADEIQFYPRGRGDPVMYVRRIDVPAGADPIQLALRAIDQRLSKMPFFKLHSKRRVTLAGRKAATVTGSYAYQGNIQYPRAVEEVFVVVGSEAFMLHFDCFERTAPSYSGQLNKFYQSFVPRPKEDTPQVPERPFPEVETMPF